MSAAFVAFYWAFVNAVLWLDHLGVPWMLAFTCFVWARRATETNARLRLELRRLERERELLLPPPPPGDGLYRVSSTRVPHSATVEPW